MNGYVDGIERAEAIPPTHDQVQWKETITSYIKENAMGLVCECGGGGMKGSGDGYKKCPICNGCGIYRWEVYGLVGKIQETLQHLHDEVMDSQHREYGHTRNCVSVPDLQAIFTRYGVRS